jgi:hypothetical protein
MAINFGRMIQGVATGAMGQYNAESAAKDKMKGEIIQRAGLNFYENTLPEFEKKEKSRKETYDKLSQRFGPDVAEYFGQNFITGDANDYKNILIELGDNPEIKADKLKQYLKATDSSYTKRAESRFNAIKEREKTIMGLTTGDSKIGTMTAQLQIPESTPITETTEEVVTPAVKGTQVGPQVTEAVPEKTEMKTTALPTYEEIFGDGKKEVTNVYLDMKPEDQARYKTMADKVFDRDKDTLTGDFATAKGYNEDYKKGLDNGTISNKTTKNQYIYDRWFKEQYLPNEGKSYSSSNSKSFIGSNLVEPIDITNAREIVNQLKAINPDDPNILVILDDVKSKTGIQDLSVYGL